MNINVNVLIVPGSPRQQMALLRAHVLMAAPPCVHNSQGWPLPDFFDHCALVPGFPDGQGVAILTEAPWSPAVPQESGLGDTFEDRVPPTGGRSERWVLHLRLVGPTGERGCRGENDVKWCRRSRRSWREPQNVEMVVVGIDGDGTEVISGRCRWRGHGRRVEDDGATCGGSNTHGTSGRWQGAGDARHAGSDWVLFVEVAILTGQGHVVPTKRARRRWQ